MIPEDEIFEDYDPEEPMWVPGLKKIWYEKPILICKARNRNKKMYKVGELWFWGKFEDYMIYVYSGDNLLPIDRNWYYPSIQAYFKFDAYTDFVSVNGKSPYTREQWISKGGNPEEYDNL